MDMTSYACILGHADTFFQCFLREGKGCVQPHHGSDLPIAFADLFDEALILLDSVTHSIPVRYFITQRCPDSSLANGVFDQVKGSVRYAWRGMMIDHRCRPVANAFEQRNLRGKRDVFLEQGAIHFPPQTLEDL